MAAITTNDVHLASDSVLRLVKFGAAADQGDVVYLDTSDSNRWKQADANVDVTLAGEDGIGVLTHKIDVADQFGIIAQGGRIYFSVTGNLVQGTTYRLGISPGDIQPDADAASGWFNTRIGVAGETGFNGGNSDELLLSLFASGKQIP